MQCRLGGSHDLLSAVIEISRMHQAAIAQLGERQTKDLKVPGSIPGLGMSPTPCAALGAVVAQRRGHWQKASAFFQTSLPMTSVLTITRATLPSRPIGLFFKHSVTSRDSSVGRAPDRRSEGPRFDPGSRHLFHALKNSGAGGNQGEGLCSTIRFLATNP